MLEAARVLLHQEVLPKAPVVFLWTGGEEPISPVSDHTLWTMGWSGGMCMKVMPGKQCAQSCW